MNKKKKERTIVFLLSIMSAYLLQTKLFLSFARLWFLSLILNRRKRECELNVKNQLYNNNTQNVHIFTKKKKKQRKRRV